jgi:hypothetical protein
VWCACAGLLCMIASNPATSQQHLRWHTPMGHRHCTRLADSLYQQSLPPCSSPTRPSLPTPFLTVCLLPPQPATPPHLPPAGVCAGCAFTSPALTIS